MILTYKNILELIPFELWIVLNSLWLNSTIFCDTNTCGSNKNIFRTLFVTMVNCWFLWFLSFHFIYSTFMCIFKCIGSFNSNKWQNRRAIQMKIHLIHTCYLITTALFSKLTNRPVNQLILWLYMILSFQYSHTQWTGFVNFPLNNSQTATKQFEWKMHTQCTLMQYIACNPLWKHYVCIWFECLDNMRKMAMRMRLRTLLAH